MWAEHVLSRPLLRRARGGEPRAISVDVRLNWSRSVPMSCVQAITLSVDGQPVRAETLTLDHHGEALPLSAWADRDDVWWPVLDPITLTASTAEHLEPGAHRIDVEMRVRVPSFPPGPDGVWPTRFNRVTAVAELD
jgi:hypothetical protein